MNRKPSPSYKAVGLLIALLLCTGSAFAGPLEEAKVTKVINEVKLIDPGVGARPAVVQDVVKGDIGLQTGLKSRSELLFSDDTLTRIGPETYFSFRSGTREMNLKQGSMLLQVPKNLGGAKIHTAAITASITGTTIMMEYMPGKDIKVLVLEGSLRLSMNGGLGDSLLLTPGRMVIMPPNAKRIPDPVTVDLKKVTQTSTLVNMSGGKKGKHGSEGPKELPSMSLIEKEINQQQQGKDGHHLLDTNLVILGKGTNVLVASDALMGVLEQRTNIANTENLTVDPPQPSPVASATPTPAPSATPLPTPDSSPTPNPNPTPVGTPTPPPPSGYIADNTTVIVTNNAGPTITTQGVTTAGVIYKDLNTNGSPAGFLFGSASAFDNSLNFDSHYGQEIGTSAVFVFNSLQLGGLTFQTQNGANSVTLVGNAGITNTPGTTIDLSGINEILFATQAGNIILDAGISFMTTRGDRPSYVEFYARGGDLTTGAAFTLANSDLQFSAEDNVDFTPSATVTARNLNVNGLQSVQFDGNANVGQVFQLDGGAVELGGTVAARNAFLYGSSVTINGSLQSGGALTANVTGDFVLNNGGSLVANGDGDTSITAGGNLSLLGNTSADHKLLLTAANALALGGTVTTNDSLTATAGTATVNGTLNVRGADFETTGDFVLGPTGASTSVGDTIVNANGGAITLNGAMSANDLHFTATGDITVNGMLTGVQTLSPLGVLTGGAIALSTVGNVAINQAINAAQVTITGGSVDLGTDLSLTGSQNELTATNGGINATGHQLSGFDQVSLTNGDLLAGGLSAGTLIVNQSGNVNVTGNLSLTKSLTTPGAVIVGGLFSAPTVTAGDITTNALHTNSLTSSGILSLGSSDLAKLSGGGLSLTAASMVFSADISLSGTNADLTTTNGNIDATGRQLSGFDLVSVSNGNFIAGGLQANTLVVNQSGSVNVANNLNLKNPFSGLGTVTVGGLLTTPTITAGNITTNALHTNTVTSSGIFTLGSTDLAPFSNSTVSITAPTVSFLAGANLNGQNGTASAAAKGGSSLTVNTGTFALNSSLNLNGGDAVSSSGPNSSGGGGGQLNVTSSDSITLNAPVSATTGQNGVNNVNAGNGGTVNLTAANTVTLNDKIEVSSNTGKRRSNKGGNINVTSNKTSGTAIAVNNSAQLLALLNSTVSNGGGSIKFVSAGGDINVNGATMQADHGTIDVHNNGASGVVNVNNATLNASTIKIGALGTNGTLNVGGGTMSADSVIHLYAGGSNGNVNFTQNVTLSGNSVKAIAGDSVTIFNGKLVTINGPAAANVFTNHANYMGFGGNGSTTGTFGGMGAVTHALSLAPGY